MYECDVDWVNEIERIPEPLITTEVFDDDHIHRGHSTYTGFGKGTNGDYWDCYCLNGGCKPPSTLENFLKYIDNANQVREWRNKYKFTMIVCFCWCCQGADPVVIYGWPNSESDYININVDNVDNNNWTVPSDTHAFFISSDDKLIYCGKKINI